MTIADVEKILLKQAITEEVIDVLPVSGGDINGALQIRTSAQVFFLKWNHAEIFPKMFEHENAGLKLLRESNTFFIPNVYTTGIESGKSFLLMDWVNEDYKDSNFWEDFGVKLAKLHQCSNAMFGLNHDNYIGSIPQRNKQSVSWTDFFVQQRLEPLFRKAFDKGLVSSSLETKFSSVCKKLDELIPQEKAALVHGDLWSGNFLSSKFGPALIDPSVYYGHREMDLAMMHLFGGFEPELFDVYHQIYPLHQGWQERLDIHNLYPLLVHVMLFGEDYIQPIESTLSKF